MVQLARRVWLHCVRVRFHLFQKRRLRKAVIEYVEGKPFVVLPGVFNPSIFLSGSFLARCLKPEMFPRGCRVLDLGTGCGLGAVFAAAWADRVVATDLNPTAVKCARINARLNQVDQLVEVRHGDLFDAVPKESFERIIFNPPYLIGSPRNELEIALKSPDMARRFCAEASRYLAPNGIAYVVLSSAGAEEIFVRELEANRFELAVDQSEELFTETLRLYRVEATIPGRYPEAMPELSSRVGGR